MFQIRCSGWLSILAIFFTVSVLGQTTPRIIVSWDAVTAAAKYQVETTVGTLPFIKAAECPASPCTVTGIEGTTTYQVRVAGVESNGKIGNYSTPLPFMFAAIQPFAPTSLTQSSASSTQPGKIAKKLSWTAVTQFRTGPFPPGTIVTYKIYQADTSPSVLIATSNTNSFTIQALTKNKTFQFYVTCVVNGIESFASPAVRVVT